MNNGAGASDGSKEPGSNGAAGQGAKHAAARKIAAAGEASAGGAEGAIATRRRPSQAAAGVARTPVFTFGKNNYSQLGLEHADASIGHIDQQCEPQLLRFFRERRVVQVACGYEHSVVVTENCEVFGFGRNDNAQLGLGHTNNSHNTPQRIPALCGKEVVSLKCGAHFSLTLMADGDVYGHGANRHGQLGLGHPREQTLPVRVPALSGKGVAVIACGGYHSMVATRRQDFFTFGKNERSQLGLGEAFQRVAQVETPTRCEDLCGVEISHLAGGFRHSVVATADNRVFGFGNNRYGELGLGDLQTEAGRPMLRVPGPIEVKALAGRGVVDVACGEYHTVAVLSDGDVVSFGYNGCGQLGLGHTDSRSEPERVEPLCQQQVWAVECGYYHTVALTEQGAVFAFGYNANGMLGLGHTDEMLVPSQLPGLMSPQLRVASLCRSHHTMLFQAAQTETPASELAGVLATGGDVATTTAGIVASVISAANPQEKATEVGAVIKVLEAAVAQAPMLAKTLGSEVAAALGRHGEEYRAKTDTALAGGRAVLAAMKTCSTEAEAAQRRISQLQRKMKDLEREMLGEEAMLERQLSGVRRGQREQGEQLEEGKLLQLEGQRLVALAAGLGRLSGTKPVTIMAMDVVALTAAEDAGGGGPAKAGGGGVASAVAAMGSLSLGAASSSAAAPPPVPPPSAAGAVAPARATRSSSSSSERGGVGGAAAAASSAAAPNAGGWPPDAMASRLRESGFEEAARICERDQLGSNELQSAAHLGMTDGSDEWRRVTEVRRTGSSGARPQISRPAPPAPFHIANCACPAPSLSSTRTASEERFDMILPGARGDDDA